eukprot:m.149871 g.149871  ORF g.149871 m.149871 type:complete len:594 (-) comp14210_c0_seq2:1007-2788(-)
MASSTSADCGPDPPCIAREHGDTMTLQEAFAAWGMSECLDYTLPSAWRFEVVASAKDEAEMLEQLSIGKPFFAPKEYASDVHAKCDDALTYITRKRWNKFPRPRIAFKGGWGRPGGLLADHTQLKLCESFADVLAEDDVLNLQLFHRQGPDEPKIPALPLKLRWPIPQVFGGQSTRVLAPRDTSAQEEDQALEGGQQSHDVGAGVVVDNATRVSKKGAVTWWHLDDGGEFVYQVSLPLKRKAHLIGPNGLPVTKLFLFFPLDAYELVQQDDLTNDQYTVAGLDIFKAQGHQLPFVAQTASQSGAGKPSLPKVWIAPLEAGGQPLMSTPNVPHLVITVQDCVMIEQRRIGKLFLDEIVYFRERARRWAEPPILYNYITTTLHDTGYLSSELLPWLQHLAAGKAEDTTTTKDVHSSVGAESEAEAVESELSPELISFMQRRALASLGSMIECPKHFGLERSQTQELRRSLGAMCAALEGGGAASYSNVDGCAATIFNTINAMRHMSPGVSRVMDGAYAARVYVDKMMWFGPLRETQQQATIDLAFLKEQVLAGTVVDLLKSLHSGDQNAAAQFESLHMAAAAAGAADDDEDDLFD